MEKELQSQINESYLQTSLQSPKQKKPSKKRKHRKFQEKYRAKDLANFDLDEEEAKDELSEDKLIELELNDRVEEMPTETHEQRIRPRLSANSSSSNVTYKTANSFQDALGYELDDVEINRKT